MGGQDLSQEEGPDAQALSQEGPGAQAQGPDASPLSQEGPDAPEQSSDQVMAVLYLSLFNTQFNIYLDRLSFTSIPISSQMELC